MDLGALGKFWHVELNKKCPFNFGTSPHFSDDHPKIEHWPGFCPVFSCEIFSLSRLRRYVINPGWSQIRVVMDALGLANLVYRLLVALFISQSRPFHRPGRNSSKYGMTPCIRTPDNSGGGQISIRTLFCENARCKCALSE